MESFKRYWQKPGTAVEHRHLKDTITDPNSHPQHPGRLVPEYCRTKKESTKLTQLKQAKSGTQVITGAELEEIEKTFNVKADPKHPKKLGNTGILLIQEPGRGVTYLRKGAA